MASSPKKQQAAGSAEVTHLPAALLLAFTGGMLDAIVWLNHGHVFANAMTGNVVLLGIAAVTADWQLILPHITPILAYVAGVSTARLLERLVPRPITHLALLVEAAVLGLAGWFAPAMPQPAFVAAIAFVSAFQVTNFRKVGSTSYNSTFITGNLRDVVEGAWDSRLDPDAAQRFKARQKVMRLGLICLLFFLGAALGALAARLSPRHDIWWAEPSLLLVLLLTLLKPVPHS